MARNLDRELNYRMTEDVVARPMSQERPAFSVQAPHDRRPIRFHY